VRPYHFTTTSLAVALTKISDQGADFMGLAACAAEAYFVKLWWQPPGNTTIPTVGTTPPNLTIQVPSTGSPPVAWSRPLNPGGPAWVAVTKYQTDIDTTTVAGGDVITLFLD
jgi:hypothetical protein